MTTTIVTGYHQIFNNGKNGYKGQDARTVQLFAESLKMQLNTKLLDDDVLWGKRLPNGTYTGQKGLIVRGEMDIGATSNWPNDIEISKRDMIYPHILDEICLLSRAPGEVPKWYALIMPFKDIMWAVVVLLVILGGALMVAFAWTYKLAVGTSRAWLDWKKAFFYNIGALLRIPQIIDRSRWHLRVYITTLWLQYFFLTTIYIATLVSLISVPIVSPPLETIKDALTNGPKPFFGIQSLYHMYLNSTNPFVQESLKNYEIIPYDVDLFAAANQGKGITWEQKMVTQFYQRVVYRDQYDTPTIQIVDECLGLIHQVALAPKNSLFTPDFDKLSIRLTEMGLSKYWFNEAIEELKKTQPNPQPDLYEKQTLRAYGLSDLQGGFYALIFFFIVSILAFILEFVFYQMNKVAHD
ncbi:hypothetical protein QYM36_002854 [Artemia franciscana]|uniref:Uncharacterized protein n=1 Tax=Artemia franciscana TaxID=6661 RepID=A0AA88I209_ARTSF|nr:hypothetical protein QYM36_002854 [Artemia franciscana]